MYQVTADVTFNAFPTEPNSRDSRSAKVFAYAFFLTIQYLTLLDIIVET